MIHPAALLAVVEMHREAAARPPAEIVVRRGDSLSEIAARYRIEWPGLYEANRTVIGGNPSLIMTGEHLRIPSAAQAAQLAGSYRQAAVAAVPAYPASGTAAPTAPTAPTAAQPVSASYAAAAGSFQQCVISRESGGNSQVMNGSGHYGLYQFSYSAWTAAGGSPADFGHASVGEQNQVFATAYAEDGASPWAPYDGC
ncbi:MAG: LysM peptidoglycan-binding domain-containing protein [Streptosporangiaceae bacterium]